MEQQPLTKQLLERLEDWCKQKRGRQVLAAKAVGVSRQRISDWFAQRTGPTGEQALRIQAFLKTRHK